MLKKRKTILALAIIFIFILFFYQNYTVEAGINESTSSKIHKKLDKKEDFILYIGRENCPYCQLVKPNLHTFSKNNNEAIFYLNTRSKNDSNDDVASLLEEFSVDTVPTILIVDNGAIKKTYTGVDEYSEFKNEFAIINEMRE